MDPGPVVGLELEHGRMRGVPVPLRIVRTVDVTGPLELPVLVLEARAAFGRVRRVVLRAASLAALRFG